MLAALVFLALVSSASARVWTGSASGPFPFVGKFAFGPAGGTIEASLGDTVSTELVAVDDTVWKPSGSGPSLCPGAYRTIMPGATSASIDSRGRPYFYFLLLGSAPINGAAACSSGVSTAYTVKATQADGGQLSYEELGLPAVYGVFWALASAQLAYHVWRHYSNGAVFAPLIVRCLTLTLALHAFSDFFHLIEWSLVAGSGRGSVFLAVAAALLRLVAQASMWVLGALAAVGHGISSSDGNWRAHLDFADWRMLRGVALLASLILTYLVTAVFYAATSANAATRATPGSAWAAVVLIGLTLGYLVWFFVRMRATKAAEISLPKKTMLDRLTWALAAAFCVLPLAELMGAFRGRAELAWVARAFPPRTRVSLRSTLWQLLHHCLNSCTTYPCSPCRPRSRRAPAVGIAAHRRRDGPLPPPRRQRRAALDPPPRARGRRLQGARDRRRRELARRGVQRAHGRRGEPGLRRRAGRERAAQRLLRVIL